jgi:uncharacterized RDD family membrane protein YckC
MNGSRDNSLLIRTPEGIEFALPLAGPFSRMLALAVDLGAIAVLVSVLEKVLAPLAVLGQDISGGVHILVDFVLTLIYAMALEWLWRGQTVGKRLMGLRVVDARGLRLEPSQVIVRNLLRALDALPALYLVGGIACALNGHRQRIGDIAAGTVVVRTPKLPKPNLDQLLGGKYNSLAESRHLAARLRQKIDPEIARIAVEALIRRDQLEPSARLELFGQLANHFRALVPYPPEVAEQLADEPYVRDVVELLYRPSATSASRPTTSVKTASAASPES